MERSNWNHFPLQDRLRVETLRTILQANMRDQQHASISPRRPSIGSRRTYVIACVPEPDPETLRQKLEGLLEAIPQAIDRAADTVESTFTSIPSQAQQLFSEDGLLGALVFWRENKENIKSAGQVVKESGEALVKGDTETFRQRASQFDLRWLRPRHRLHTLRTNIEDYEGASELERRARNLALFMIESLTPWDFDRHDFGLTFATVWLDAQTVERQGENGYIKMTSTIKPLHREWKVSGRTKLLDLGEDTAVFGKAGMYLHGNKPAFVGVEADHVWHLPKLENTKVFANINYRSSRRPTADPIKTSVGLQQDFFFGKGLDLTLRVGINLLDRTDWYVTPVPNCSYF